MEQFEKMGEGLWFLKVPFGPVWTGVALVRGEENILIDSTATAQDVDAYVVPALAKLGLTPKDIHWLLNTHCHGDHIGGHRRFWELSGCKVAAFEIAAPKVENPVPYAIRIRTAFRPTVPPPRAISRVYPSAKFLQTAKSSATCS